MPTLLRIGKYRFFFYANENEEPPHVHIRAGENEAKYWVEPLDLVVNYGFNGKDLKQIERHLIDNKHYILEMWMDFFGSHDDDDE